jgi:uncharacterized iron-regulated protein
MTSAAALLFVIAQATATSTQAPAPASPTPAVPHPRIAAAYVPERVYDTRRGAFTDFESMLADLARADVALVGEQHDDPNTHALEAAMLQGLMRRGVGVTVSLEMFERDVQGALDAYLAGTVAEEEFLKGSRPWPRYATDYRALVEMAKAHGWSVIASNVPRRLASAVAKSGREALAGVPDTDRPLFARDLQCPRDTYFDRFVETMGSHPTEGQDKAAADATMERYYWSQCLKDETMAESIASAFEKQTGRPGTIVHYNGAFHSDFGFGAAERTRRRLPGRRVAVVSVLPVDDLDRITPSDEDLKRADYLVYTYRPAEKQPGR